MDDKTFQDLPEVFAQRYQKVYDHYLSMVGEHVKAMGEIRASDIHKLNELAKMNANVSRIKIELNNLIKQNTEDLYIAFAKVSEAEYKSFANLYATNGLLQGDITGNVWLVKQINSIAKTTSDTFRNMANTTVMKQLYKGVVDEAVIAVSSGVVGYNKAISDTIKKTAVNGNVVEYASGLTRRRDSAVRMNVLEGIRQINAGISEATGKEFGSDGVEVSAHGLCAEDHITIQGRQYSNEEFEKLNNSLDRAIGTLNCNHFTFPILLGISSPVYSKQELEARTKNSMELIDIDGVQKTRYQWSQQQRRIETEVRKQKDIANIAKASGDDMLRRTAQNNINRYNETYKLICTKTGLEPKLERMAVKGFRGVKAKPILTGKSYGGIIKDKELPLYKIDLKSVLAVKPFNCDTMGKSEQIKLANEHKKLLTSLVNKPLGTEASATYDLNMNKLGEFLGKDADSKVKFFKADKPCVVIHNHPTGGTFTHTDINAFARDDNIKMLTVVGNNGAVYGIEKTSSFNYHEYVIYQREILARHKYYDNSISNYESFIQDFLGGIEKYGFNYYR